MKLSPAWRDRSRNEKRVGEKGLEPLTSRMWAVRSNRLSYSPSAWNRILPEPAPNLSLLATANVPMLWETIQAGGGTPPAVP